MSIPESHLEEGLKLTADAEVDLFTLSLVSAPLVFRFKNNNTATWRGDTYEGMACSMSGDRRSADEEEGRPVIRVVNPEGVFNKPAIDGMLDRAILTRKTVLLQHLDGNVNISRQRMWYVERVKELVSGQMLGLELRSMTDLPGFQLPVRMFMPPEFPTVSL
jgi:phage-related protein